jgi:hypothetical protein
MYKYDGTTTTNSYYLDSSIQIPGGNTLDIIRVIYTGTTWIAVGNYINSSNNRQLFIMYSTNGTSWQQGYTISPSNHSSSFNDAYWNGYDIVVVGTNLGSGYALILNKKPANSTDFGATWDATNNKVTASVYFATHLRGVVSNGVIWIAVGTKTTTQASTPAGFIIISSNGGATWTESTYTMSGTSSPNQHISTGIGMLMTIAVVNGLFMTSGGNYIYTSLDGNNWTYISSISAVSTIYPTRILTNNLPNNYENTTIFMTGQSTQSSVPSGVFYSTDYGATWTSLISVTNTGEIFTDIQMINSTTAIAVGYGGSANNYNRFIYTINVNTRAYSDISSTIPSLPTTSIKILSFGSTYVPPLYPISPLVFGSSADSGGIYNYRIVQYIENDTTGSYYDSAFTNKSIAQKMRVNKIIYTGYKWLAVGKYELYTTQYYYILSSTDGINWIDVYNFNLNSPNIECYDVYWNGSMAVAVGYIDNVLSIQYSTNLIGWVTGTTPTNATLTNNLHAAGGSGSVSISQLNSVVYNGTTWVAAGYCTMTTLFTAVIILTSSDGINWLHSTDASIVNKIGVVAGIPPTLGLFEGTFILCTSVGTSTPIRTSPDGIVWTLVSAGSSPITSNLHIYKTMKMNNLIIVAGLEPTNNNYAYYSSDKGSTWNAVSGPPVSGGVYSITDMKMISPTMAMMVGYIGNDPITLISTNGIVWNRINPTYSSSPLSFNTRVTTFSGKFSEFILNNKFGTATVTMSSSNLTRADSYTSSINAIPTYLCIPYVDVTFPTGVTSIQISITLTDTAGTAIASGTFVLLSANKSTYLNGINIPLNLAQPNLYIISGTQVTYTLSVTSTAIGTGTIKVRNNFGLVATLYGYTYFLPSTLTLPTATSGGTEWYIPSPIFYLSNKQVWGQLITNTVPSTAKDFITYSATINPNSNPSSISAVADKFTLNSTWFLRLTIGTGSLVPNIPINVIASYAGNNVYLATSTTKTVYLNNYLPVSPATAVFLNKSGRTGIFSETVIPSGIGAGSTVFGTLSVTINITNNITLNEFNFGCYDLIGHAGYRIWGNPHTFIMTVQDMASGPNPTTVTTVTFNAIMPPPNSTQQDLQSGSSEYYAMTYINTASASRNNDGMLLSIPFYDISGNLVPTYVNSFSITGTRSPQFKLGDVIKITLSCRNFITQSPASYWVYSSFNGDMCGALIATPTTTTTTTENIYTTSLSNIAYMGNSTTSIIRSTSQINYNISSCPAITVSMRTMVTGFYIASMGLQTGESGVFSLRVYNSGTLVLTVNFQCTLPSTRKPLFIPFSYVSQAQNPTTTTPSAQLDYISFSSGVQNPIYEPGSQFSCSLVQINSSNANISYSSTGLNSGVIVSEAYGTTMLAYTKLAVSTPTITPVQMTSSSKMIQFTSSTTPAGVGGAITYAVSPDFIGSINSSTGALTISNSSGYLGRATANASQAATPLYNPATASASVDIIGYTSTNMFGNIGTNTGISDQNMYNNTNNGYFIDVNIVTRTTITGISFQYSGRMTSSSNGYSALMVMKLSKTNNPGLVFASTSFTFSDTYDTNNDGTLCIIPFVVGTTFNENTYPITIKPTKITSVEGSLMQINDALTFDAGDTIRITLSNASNPTKIVNVYTHTSNPSSTLACSVISTVTNSFSPFGSSLFVNNPVSPISLGNSVPSQWNGFQSSITSQIQVNFPNFSTAIIATGFTIPVQMNSHGTYEGQLMLAYSAGGGAILVIDFTLDSASTSSSAYINLQFPFNMPIGTQIGTKMWADNQIIGYNGGYYITNVTTKITNTSYSLPNINNGFLNISSNPRLGSASAAATGAYNYVILGLSGTFKYQQSTYNSPYGGGSNAVCALYGTTLSTTN